MTILWGDTGRTVIGPLKTINISLATPRENSSTLSPSDTSFSSSLPTTQTSSIGATFTLQQSDLPTVTGLPTSNIQYTAQVIISGKNTAASTVTVNSQCFKNGSSLAVAGNSTVATNLFWTHMCYRFNGVVVGDTLNVQAWASAAGVTYDYCALVIYPTSIILSKAGTILKDLTFSNYQTSAYPVFSNLPSGTMNYGLFTQNFILNVSSLKGFNLDSTGTTLIGTVAPYNLKVNYGDSNINTQMTSNSTSRYIAKNVVPQTITYREVLR